MTTAHPVDSSRVTQGSGIPDADLGRLIAATIPPPAGAVEVHPWKGDRRRFYGTARSGAVLMAGDQDRAGNIVAAWVAVENSVGRLGADEARGLAAALIAAADDLDTLNVAAVAK
ncbi:MAG: hypothetical protein WA942_17400 [Mycolicibacter sinensis]